MQFKRIFLTIGLIFIFLIATIFIFREDSPKDEKEKESLEVSANLLEGMVFRSGTENIPIQGVDRISIENQNGNTFIKHAKQEDITIDAVISDKDKIEPEYKVSQKGKEMIIEVVYLADSAPLNLKLTIPKEIKEIDSHSTFGNIRGEINETNFIRFVTYFGNLLTEFDNINQQGEYIFMTNVGQIYTVVPDKTELNYLNQSPSGNTLLKDVKENKTAVQFITTVRDAGWYPPQFISKSAFEQIGQSEQSAPITNQQLKEDLDETILKLKELHPHVVQNPSFYEPFFEQAGEKIQTAKNRVDLYFILSELMAATKDGHTLVHFMQDRIELPQIKWTTKDELIVTEDMDDFQRGDRIISIGGKSDKIIMDAARTYIAAEHEGYIKASIGGFLSNPVHLKHFDMVNDSGVVSIVFERSGTEQTTSIPIKETPSGAETLDLLYKHQVNSPYDWFIDPAGKYGVFTMDEALQTEMYSNMLKAFFSEMQKKNVSNLVVDIRNNSGGNGLVTDEFISYLNVDTYHNGVSIVQNQKVSNDYLFDGNVYVLTSFNTFSAGTDFAKFIQGNGIGTLVGESPGNNASYGGNISQLSLKNSGIYMQIPTHKLPAPVPDDEQDQPLKVDYPVEVTRESILSGKDLWMEKIDVITSNQ